MNMHTDKQARVVRVTRTEFELSDGRIYEHPVPLDVEQVPTIEEFQRTYDHWKGVITEHVKEAHRQADRAD